MLIILKEGNTTIALHAIAVLTLKEAKPVSMVRQGVGLEILEIVFQTVWNGFYHPMRQKLLGHF